jgi:hypothetical protein
VVRGLRIKVTVKAMAGAFRVWRSGHTDFHPRGGFVFAAAAHDQAETSLALVPFFRKG